MPSLFTTESLPIGAGATFDPSDLKVISAAFNEAWAEVESHYSRKGLTAQSVRTKLASAILEAAVPATNRRNAEALKAAALRAFYRT